MSPTQIFNRLHLESWPIKSSSLWANQFTTTKPKSKAKGNSYNNKPHFREYQTSVWVVVLLTNIESCHFQLASVSLKNETELQHLTLIAVFPSRQGSLVKPNITPSQQTAPHMQRAFDSAPCLWYSCSVFWKGRGAQGHGTPHTGLQARCLDIVHAFSLKLTSGVSEKLPFLRLQGGWISTISWNSIFY